MKALSHALIATGIALVVASASTRGDGLEHSEPHGDCRDNLPEAMSGYLHRVKGEFCFVRYFIADKDAFLYAEGMPSEAEGPIGRIAMGSAYFAIQEGPERIRIATHGEAGSEVKGWARRGDLLEDLYKAVPLGEAHDRGILVRAGHLAGGIEPNNELHLRVVSQPERGTIVARAPGVDQGDPIFSWRWYYIFDTERHGEDGRVWGLLGRIPALRGEDLSPRSTDELRIEKVLNGWAPLDEMTVWATHLAVEVNTARAAVEQRRGDQGPAVVHSIDRPDANPMWVEPIDDPWYKLGSFVRQDPHGMDRTLLRKAVIQPLGKEYEYVEVASAASRTGRLAPSELDELRRKVEDAMDDLMRMDIVFVVDATASMADDIETTRYLIGEIGKTMEQAAGRKEKVIVESPELGGIDVSTALDIAVSVIGFKDTEDVAQLRRSEARKGNLEGSEDHYYTTKAYGKRLDVIKKEAKIDNAFDRMIGDTNYLSGKEALYEGLREAFARDAQGRERYWRESVVSRVVVVLTDEPGNSGPDQLQALMAEMPGFSEYERRIMGKSGDGSSGPDEKKEKTQVFTVFLGEQYCYEDAPEFDCKAQFRANMEDITYGRRIFDRKKRREQRIVRAIRSMIAEYTAETETRYKALNEMFVEELKEEGGARQVFRATSGLTRLAIGMALERAGLTFEELRKLNEVVYYSGYVRVDEIAPPPDQQSEVVRDGPPPKWRMRVMLRKEDVLDLEAATKDVCNGLSAILPPADPVGGWEPPPWWEASTVDPKENIARLILLSLDKIADGKGYEGEEGTKKLDIQVKALLDSKKDLGEAARFLRVARWLPLRPGGFLSSDLKELLDRDIAWFLGETERLCNKHKGLRRILEDLTIPEDPATMSNADSDKKFWFYRLGISSDTEVAHVPIGYIP